MLSPRMTENGRVLLQKSRGSSAETKVVFACLSAIEPQRSEWIGDIIGKTIGRVDLIVIGERNRQSFVKVADQLASTSPLPRGFPSNSRRGERVHFARVKGSFPAIA